MTKLKIGICGWGNVATGLYEQLICGNELYSKWELVCIGARRDNPRCNPGDTKIVRDIFAVPDEDIDILVELIGGVETARELILKALNAGKHVVTANKAVIYEHGEELIQVAIKNNVKILFESAVCAGTPVVKMLSNDLGANKISKVAGMLNGTTNFILSNMEEGANYANVLQEAQEKGYAEPDPSLDVNGTDAAHKIGILASLAFNSGLPASTFHIEGIEDITSQDFKYAHEFNLTVKHLAVAQLQDHGIELRSHPVMLSKESSLAGLQGVRNGIQINTDLLGEFQVAGSGAGRESTASGLISDLIALSKNQDIDPMRYPDFSKKPNIIDFNELSFKYYVYLEVKDESGVLALVSKIFAEHKISFDKVIQKDQLDNGNVPMVIFTDPVIESEMQIALKDLKSNSVIHNSKIIRIEDS
ncbi:homoserine dehydrogenase [Pseudomonadota bacterium]|jgi:homoserine dehydrogenase|nr:homoserine dehydrogenase [Pseudomonadota bacterium]